LLMAIDDALHRAKGPPCPSGCSEDEHTFCTPFQREAAGSVHIRTIGRESASIKRNIDSRDGTQN
jgi:hypothetical protein